MPEYELKFHGAKSLPLVVAELSNLGKLADNPQVYVERGKTIYVYVFLVKERAYIARIRLEEGQDKAKPPKPHTVVIGSESKALTYILAKTLCTRLPGVKWLNCPELPDTYTLYHLKNGGNR